MDILMADRHTDPARTVARILEEQGHTVRSCRDQPARGRVSCAALRGDTCPLDAFPIDMAVSVGNDAGRDGMGDGSLCAARRHIPLVLVDAPHAPLRPWAEANVPVQFVAKAVEAVHSEPLPSHSEVAREMLRSRLAGLDISPDRADVTVRRLGGTLRVDLTVDKELRAAGTDNLVVAIVQAVRAHDRWAAGIDVSVHSADEPISGTSSV